MKRLFILLSGLLFLAASANAIEIDKEASIDDTDTSVLGINHIGLSVQNLDSMLKFYLAATNFELLRREKVADNPHADKLYGHENIAYETAVLKAPNMLLELTEFEHNKSFKVNRMPPQGPGMTHTCYQSPMSDPGYNKFIKAGAAPLSRGDAPVDLGGYGVTYAYAYDPEGNMLELEQLDGEVLARSGYDQTWQELNTDLWMSQVGIATHDIERLMMFYQNVLGFKPYRTGEVADNPKADDIAAIDDLHIKGGWFKMNNKSKVLEFWQYIHPQTIQQQAPRSATDLGYTFSLEVADIQAEYQRLSDSGVEFISTPVEIGNYWQVFAYDPDGNVFALREYVDANSVLSVRKLDALD